MPKATVTVRELKNKDTCVDLSVTSYREIPGLVRSTFEYQIVVVSSLSCFKLPSHKETDVVQFTLFKKFAEFEDLRAKLNEAFSGTALPQLSKRSLIVNEAVIKERRNSLDSFMKFLSWTPRVVTCSHVLTFLGVEEQKAKRFASGDTELSAQGSEGKTEKTDDENKLEGMTSSNLFEEEEEEEDAEDFLTAGTSAARAREDDDDFFSTPDPQSSSTSNTRLFERQDLKRELTEEDEKDFAFIPDAIITKREVIKVSAEENETDELLNVDEDIDLDKLLTLESGSKQERQEPTTPSKPLPKPKPSPTKPQPPAKPQPPQKPSVPVKPKPGPRSTEGDIKPVVPSKPTSPDLQTESASSPLAGKPVPPQRPKPAPRKLKPQKLEKEPGGEGSTISGNVPAKSEMSSDDIMQYIAANAAEGEDGEPDLFS